MASKHRAAQDGRKASFERTLKERLAFLAARGIEGRGIDRDPIVKKLRADIAGRKNEA